MLDKKKTVSFRFVFFSNLREVLLIYWELFSVKRRV